MLRRIYDWCIDSAHKPYSVWIMGAVSFAESSFFPVPPDVMLIPMSLARPERAWFYAMVCTVTSVLGGIVGYGIGALLYDSLGQWLIQIYGLSGKVEAFRASYAEWGALIIIGKGLTPIPYKLVTITSGFAGYNIWLFVPVQQKLGAFLRTLPEYPFQQGSSLNAAGINYDSLKAMQAMKRLKELETLAPPGN